MIIQRRKHRVPGLNTTSTADISFMLLIFFLVTTNMDVDKGLSRQLPPVNKEENQQSFAEKGTTMALKITPDNKLIVNDKQQPIKGLRNQVISFVERVGKRHLITVEADPQSDYNTYFHLQNELVAAYRVLRNQTAQRLYHRNFAALSPQQKDHVRDVCPQHIAEQYHDPAAGPVAAGGAGQQSAAGKAKGGQQ
ncbi:MAG: biopolymer transporter ExbD [Prevotella sp.]|jgi:biopolymer transport protein ExbD|nr:biopolymer transporter ExbD [Prevotella sp.]